MPKLSVMAYSFDTVRFHLVRAGGRLEYVTMISRLLDASATGNSLVVRKLLRAKVVDPDVKDDLHQSALTLACKGGHYEIVKLLLEAGANVDTVSGNLVTPLHLAAQSNNEDILKLLIFHGASLDVKNQSGLKPIDYLPHYSENREIFVDAENGIKPEIEEVSEVPVIPDYAIGAGEKKKKKKTGKKGKKGKKGGKKKGGKKKKKKK